MNFHPAFDVLQKHGIRPVTNSPDGTFPSNCPSCGKLNSNFVQYDDDAVGWHCHDCGKGKIVQLRPASARPASGDGKADAGAAKGGAGGGADDKNRRAFEEARAEFPDEDEPEQAEPEPEPDPEPASEDPTGDAAEPVGDGSFSHIWRSENYDYPCTPTGEEQPDDAGRIYARVRM